MKCLRITKPKTIEVCEMEVKNELLVNEVAVKINRVSLCGSDIKLYQGKYSGPCNYPLIFGHEWSGEVIGISKEETEFCVGDYVTGDCSSWCGGCHSCKTDKNLCNNIEKFGITKDGYAREVAIINKKYLYRSTQKLPHKVLALTECFAVALHSIKAVNMSCKDRESKILIIGCGAIGTATFLLLKYHYNFNNIYMCDNNEQRIDTAMKVLGDSNLLLYKNGVDTKSDDSYANVYNNDGFDCVFESSGTSSGLDTAIEVTNSLGCISYIGLDESKMLYNLKQITMKALTIRGSIGGTGEFDEVIKFFESNINLVSKLVTLEKDYLNAKDVFEEMISNQSNIKCQIRF